MCNIYIINNQLLFYNNLHFQTIHYLFLIGARNTVVIEYLYVINIKKKYFCCKSMGYTRVMQYSYYKSLLALN